MTGLRVFRLAGFCLFLIAGSSFAAGNGATGGDISSYASAVRNSILAKGEGIFKTYKGKACVVKLYLSRDGSFSFEIQGGYPGLCNQITHVLDSMDKLPEPPSDAVYQKVKEAFLDFKP